MSGASATRIRARRRRHCCSPLSPRSQAPRPQTPAARPPDRRVARATLVGRPGSPGYGAGRLLWVAPLEPGAAAPAASVAHDAHVERTRLEAALATARDQLNALADEASARAGDDVGAIFGAQALFASDPGIVDPAMAAIDEGATAAEAIDRVTAAQADQLAAVDDEYFRERAADVRDLGGRVVDLLTGRVRPALHRSDGTPTVVAAVDLEPSQVVAIRPELVTGVALAGGAPTGHAAIVARALGIPLAVGLGAELRRELDGTSVAVDGSGGRLIIEPDATDDPATTIGPTSYAPVGAAPVEVAANVGSAREAEAAAAAAGADGIGLVRTELLFLGRSTPPGLDEQRAAYRRIADAMPGGHVVFRTLDIGGDKPAAYLGAQPEMNPALGVRGIRLSLARDDLFETQLRALLEATPDRPPWILLPMVSTVEEVAAARAALERAAAASRAAGTDVSPEFRLGVMIEIPSAAIMADAFAPIVDFFSIGTNDLVQYALAADRTSAPLAEMATALQPAVLRLIRSVTHAARQDRVHVSVCGEAAADPATAALFVGLGVDELSVAPASIGPLRAALSGVDMDACHEAAERACAAASVGEVRAIADALVARRAGG
ncbi:MAG TPA: putative PEP-binding protein [Candidatus Limnocylindrales bacterium]|nr:putative PEP-binding protein [Candidatus Limnocylindrales bacterium]